MTVKSSSVDTGLSAQVCNGDFVQLPCMQEFKQSFFQHHFGDNYSLVTFHWFSFIKHNCACCFISSVWCVSDD